ncbi:hypothetical protein A9Q83_00390 [Alphaproteobacteria bacterium 46_93_T64]|nr:hypothetical protein A9Q83_00390 [Alphaproteobacteria bacterium 46_93_T64]
MVMFKKLFGRNKEKSSVRSLDQAHDLQKGDALKIGFDEHPEISNQQFFVQKVTGLDLTEKSGFERRIFHIGNTVEGRPLLMWIDDEIGADRLAFAYGADQPHVQEMINVEQFAEIFSPDRDHLVEVDALKASLQGNPWLSTPYTEDQAKEVYWLDNDPRSVATAETISKDETACDYFRLTSKDRQAAIEAFVFSGGKTDVYFVKYLPLYKIEELMPSG